jgi:hypothetical protein
MEPGGPVLPGNAGERNRENHPPVVIAVTAVQD